VLRIDVWRAADLAAPFVGIGVAIIRFGCFLRGCCFGETTDVFWGVTFPLFSPAHLAQLSSGQAELLSSHAVHPTQLYELVGALAVGAIAWALVKKKIFPNGVAALIAAAVFTLVRLTVYFFRVMPEAYGTPAYFYPMLYITILVALVVLIIRICRKDGRCERVFSIPGVGRGLS
jgi:phosphatidylglycerol:prolipoprotein diacylglycerol transferase